MIEDLRRLGNQRREVMKRLEQVVAASGTSTTRIVGVGPVVAAMAVSITGDVERFKSIGHFADTPSTNSSDKPLPDPPTAYDRSRPPCPPRPPTLATAESRKSLDIKEASD